MDTVLNEWLKTVLALDPTLTPQMWAAELTWFFGGMGAALMLCVWQTGLRMYRSAGARVVDL